jgi:hypothetical protein
MSKETVGAIVVIAVIILLLLSCFRGALVDESVAVSTLEAGGFSEVVVKNRIWFLVSWRGGSRDDAVLFVCQAKNPAGKTVNVNVTSGWIFRNATIRMPN